MAWRLTRTGGTIDLNNTFNLQEYNRRTEFVETELDGEDDVVIDAESVRQTSQRLVLRGLIKGTDASDAESQLEDIEDVATADATDLVLRNTVTTTEYDVQHISTRALRLGAALLQVTLTFLTGFTKL